MQAILLAHERMLATLDQYTWISKYIFPGGALPSLRAIEEIVRDHTGLRVDGVDGLRRRLRPHAAAWRRAVRRARARGRRARLRRDFRRMWDFYLAYCEAGFATGYLDVAQIVLYGGG